MPEIQHIYANAKLKQVGQMNPFTLLNKVNADEREIKKGKRKKGKSDTRRRTSDNVSNTV